MKLIASKSFNLNGVFYEAGNEVTVANKDELIRLNEKGFIEPLTPKQIQEFENEPKYTRTTKIKNEEE